MMFQTDEPFASPRSSVNVFGELDGFGPSVFNVGGEGGFQQHTVVEEGYDADPEISPDGKYAAVSARDGATNDRDVWIHDLAMGTKRVIAPAKGNDNFPLWSPDGKEIIFAKRM